MNNSKKKWIIPCAGVVCLALGLFNITTIRNTAIVDSASAGDQMQYAIKLILSLLGIIAIVVPFLPKFSPKKTDTRTLTLAAMFAALCYIGFTFFKIDIPVGTEKTAFHLGNVFCVLAALFIGGFWGGMAGSIGMTIADLTTGYITSAPKTFLLKLCIGLIVGFMAHRVFRLNQEHDKRYITVATIISCAAGMAFNVVGDPLVGYFYKMYVLGIPQEIANAWAKMGAITTLVNAIVAVICASIFYLALRPALRRTGMLKASETK